ncbi:MAG: hypothetical protein AB7Q76_22235 [Gammaproteobacteria bacterium]
MKRTRRDVLSFLPALLCAWAGPAPAENALFVIPFGGEPGAPLPHAYDYGAAPASDGQYTLRVPSVDPAMQPVLPDVELTVDAASKIVSRVAASRAYRALDECTAAQKIVRGKLEKALPHPAAGDDERWQFQSADGKVVGGAYCQLARHLPFPTLQVEITQVPVP